MESFLTSLLYELGQILREEIFSRNKEEKEILREEVTSNDIIEENQETLDNFQNI